MSDLASWPRPRHQPGGGDAFLFYAVFGDFTQGLEVSRSRHRSDGAPEGVEAIRYERAEKPDYDRGFFDGYLGRLLDQDELASRAIRAAPQTMVIRGTVLDPPTLDYLRDVVGLLACALESGGVGLFDLVAMRWWRAADWRARIFEPAELLPYRHVTILKSEDDTPGRSWLHTRGLRKFGRPDVSIANVPPDADERAAGLCDRFIVLLASGEVVRDGYEVRVAGMPGGLTCTNAGSLEDPDFNNVHLAMRWPD
jgi:hypothetical protein